MSYVVLQLCLSPEARLNRRQRARVQRLRRRQCEGLDRDELAQVACTVDRREGAAPQLDAIPAPVPLKLDPLVLAVGLFANLSDDFMVLCDFLGRARTLKAINNWYISPKNALAMNLAFFDISFWSLGFFGLGKPDSGSFS